MGQPPKHALINRIGCRGLADFLHKAGNALAEARDISVCNCPIGEQLYVKKFLRNKFKGICSAIEAFSSALDASSSHADFLAFHYSYQARFDYWLSTNKIALTNPLAAEMGELLRKIMTSIAGVDIFAVPKAGTPIPDFVAERASLKFKAGGLGFRRLSRRYLLLNSFNNTMPQAIKRAYE